ncbi:MAG: hypothetical protein ABDH21_01820 [bacterium]
MKDLEEIQKKILNFVAKYKISELINLPYLVNKGITPYIVGGVIRDTCLNPKQQDKKKLDIDIVLLTFDPQKYKEYILNLQTEKKYKIVELDKKNLVYRVIPTLQNTAYATYIDLTYTTNLQKDYYRRDYTINSIYYDIINQKIIDFEKCLKHISRRILKSVRNGNIIADPIRIIRGIRIKNELNLKFDTKTYQYLKKNFFQVTNTNPVRLKQEIIKTFNIPKSYKAVKDLLDLGFLEVYNINLSTKKQLVEMIKILDICYEIFKEILQREYEFIVKDKNYYVLLLFCSYLLKNSQEFYSSPLNIIIGENIVRKATKILNDWNKRQDPKFIINNFKHKNSSQLFEMILINLILNYNKLDKQEFISTLDVLFKVCRYVCELKETVISFEKYVNLFGEKDYEKYIDYVISTLA